MRFTVAPRGMVLPPPLPKPKARLAPLGRFGKGWTSPGVREVTWAETADREWLFERQADGTWSAGHLPTRTEVKNGLRSLPACRRYAGSGRAAADLELTAARAAAAAAPTNGEKADG